MYVVSISRNKEFRKFATLGRPWKKDILFLETIQEDWYIDMWYPLFNYKEKDANKTSFKNKFLLIWQILHLYMKALTIIV